MLVCSVLGVATLVLSCASVGKDPPVYKVPPIREEFHKCDKCGSYNGGIYGKGPLKHYRTPEAKHCRHEWQKISMREFATGVSAEFGVNWSAERMPYWQRLGAFTARDVTSRSDVEKPSSTSDKRKVLVPVELGYPAGTYVHLLVPGPRTSNRISGSSTSELMTVLRTCSASNACRDWIYISKATNKRWNERKRLDDFAALSATVESAKYVPPYPTARQEFPAPNVAWGGVYEIRASRDAEHVTVCVWRVGQSFEMHVYPHADSIPEPCPIQMPERPADRDPDDTGRTQQP